MRGLDVTDEVKIGLRITCGFLEGNTLSMEKRLVLIKEDSGKDDSAVVD